MMHVIARFLFTLSLPLFLASSVMGADWAFLARSPSGVPVYYDRESLTVTDKKTVTVWTKAAYTEAEQHPAGLEEYVYALGLIEVDCQERTFIIRQTAVYDRHDNCLAAYSPQWGLIPPEPQLLKLFEVACQDQHGVSQQ